MSLNLFARAQIDPYLYDFRSDGCSLIPDGTFKDPNLWHHCCVVHDLRYWAGGDKVDRKKSDLELKYCIEKIGKKTVANIVYRGVRFGGGAFISSIYRTLFHVKLGWGYGWEENRKYRKLSKKELQLVLEKTPDDLSDYER